MDDTLILTVLQSDTASMSEADRIRHVYNEAIDDAANFLRDLAPHNPMQAATLLSAEQEVRRLALAKADAPV